MVGWWLVNVINIVSKWGVVMIKGIEVILGHLGKVTGNRSRNY